MLSLYEGNQITLDELQFFWESILFVLKIELQPQQARLVILSYLRILHEGKIFEGNTNRKYYNFSILWDPFN
jgi:thymidine kinase